jgi:hypothetical protein
MAELNITKGEWRAEGTNVVVNGKILGHNLPVMIAQAYDPNDHLHSTDIAKANAHLIAAAPGMYEALKKVFARQEIVKGRVVLRGMPTEDEIFEIDEALAKAEGK